jgi:hypothetical protein
MEAREKDLTESFDTLQDRILESLSKCSKYFVCNEFTVFAAAFENYQESAWDSINDFNSIDADHFNTVCTKFVTQIGIARDAVVKLIVMERLNLFLTVMLAHERRQQSTQEDGTCTGFATKVSSLPSVLFEMIAEAMISNGEEVEL